MTASPPGSPDFFAERAQKSEEHHADIAYSSDAVVGLPSEEEALATYSAVWQNAPGIDAHNVDIVRREAMAAAYALIRPAFEAKDAEAQHWQTRATVYKRLMTDAQRGKDAAEAKLAQAVEDERGACLRAALCVCEDMRNEGENDMRMARDRIDDAIRARTASAAARGET